MVKYIVMMAMERSSITVIFLLILGRIHISHNTVYALSSNLSIYNTSIAIVLRDYNAAFLYHC